MNITPTAASTPCRKKRKMRKTDNDSVPLSDPFPLPKHYRADVETALKLGKMTKETRSAFLSSVAGSMLNCKRYPTKEDYICVARSVIKTYPFMASPAGRPYVRSLFLLRVDYSIGPARRAARALFSRRARAARLRSSRKCTCWIFNPRTCLCPCPCPKCTFCRIYRHFVLYYNKFNSTLGSGERHFRSCPAASVLARSLNQWVP